MMMRALWRDGAVYTAGALLSRGVALLLLPLLTRVLGPADYGALDLISAWGVLVALVVPLEIAQGLARLWNESPAGEARRRLAGTAWTFVSTGYGLFALLGMAAAEPLARLLLGESGWAAALRAGVCFVAANGVFTLLQSQFRWELRPIAYTMVSLLYALATLALVALASLGLRAGLAGVLWAQCGAALLCSCVGYGLLHRGLRWGIARHELAAMLRYSLPLVPAGVAVFVSLYINRLMLNALAPLSDVGQFGIASRLAGAVTLTLVGIQAALTPLIYAHHRDPETPALLARLLEGFSALALLCCLTIGVFGSELIALVATEEFLPAAPLLSWLAPAALISQMYVFAPGIAIAKKTHWQLGVTLVAAAAGALLNAVLIPLAGTAGAAWATLASAAVFFGTWLAVSQRCYPLPLRAVALAGAGAVYVVLALAASHMPAALHGAAAALVVKLVLLFVFAAALSVLGLLRPLAWRGVSGEQGS